MGFQRGLGVGSLLPVAAVLAAVLCAPAAATFTASIPGNLSPSLTYKVHGEITSNCQLSQLGRDVQIVDLADPATDLARAATTSLPFEIACNTPVRVAMSSRHGGLKFDGAATSDGDFTPLVRYRARLDLPRHSGALECASEAMGGGQASCRGDIAQPVASGNGAVEVQVAPGTGLLLAGRYSDQVTVTITPILGSGGM
jgi:hypothetical protein